MNEVENELAKLKQCYDQQRYPGDLYAELETLIDERAVELPGKSKPFPKRNVWLAASLAISFSLIGILIALVFKNPRSFDDNLAKSLQTSNESTGVKKRTEPSLIVLKESKAFELSFAADRKSKLVSYEVGKSKRNWSNKGVKRTFDSGTRIFSFNETTGKSVSNKPKSNHLSNRAKSALQSGFSKRIDRQSLFSFKAISILDYRR